MTNVPSSLQKFTTGDTLVTVNNTSTMTFEGISAGPSGGTGGLIFTAGISFKNGDAVLVADGNFAATSLGWGNTGSITQNGGLFDVSTFSLPKIGTVNIPAYEFAANKPTVITAGVTPHGTYTLTGTMVFQDGHRPNWTLQSNYSTGINSVWNLNGFTMVGNTITIQGGGNPLNRYATLRNTNTVTGGPGAHIDANVLSVGNSNYAAPYLDFTTPVTVTLRGNNTIYINYSVNNDGTEKTVAGEITNWPRPFKTDTSTFIFDPDGGTASIHTGSEDRNSTDFNPADWKDNFAFDTVRIGDGDTITLIGDANVGSGKNALYARTIDCVSGTGTINLNGHNIYLLEEPSSSVIFDDSGGGAVYWPIPLGTVILIK